MDVKFGMQHSNEKYPFMDSVSYVDNNDDIDPSGPNSVEKTKKGSKVVGGGLRQYSNMVCMKVKDKGRTTYSEVADEIIADFRAMEVNSSASMNESDEKNIRRRVYDVLNVLMALDIVRKDRKEIQWNGLPTSDGGDIEEIKTKKGSKVVGGGLRQYSNMVCMKVKDKGRTTYSEVADEIIADFRAMEVNSSASMNESDEKNIRRRVYDVLNVLMALDIVRKDRKEIQWNGLPTSDGGDIEEIKGMRAKLKDEINKKAAYLKDLEDQIAGHQALIWRNKQLHNSNNGPPHGFSLPFLIAKTAPHATVEIEISEDMQLVHFDFNSTPFSLHDDAYILQMMRHYRLLEGAQASQTSAVLSSSPCSDVDSSGAGRR